MKKFVAIYMAPAASVVELMKATPQEMKAEMDAWNGWYEKNKGAIVDEGAPLGKTKRLTASGLSDSRNDITGYSVVEGDSVEAVARIFKDHPHLKLKDASVDILDWVDMASFNPA